MIGVQSLGSLFTDGFQRGIQAEIVTGIVATIVLALGLDWASVLIGRLLMPWTRRSVVNGQACIHAVREPGGCRMNLLLEGISLDPRPRELDGRRAASPSASGSTS